MTETFKDPVYFLIVDDLEENLLSLEALLRKDGLSILKARSGPEALELLLLHNVALALLDVQMPGMDGFELAELMRGTERTRRIPIIFLTAGNADKQRRFRGYEAGAVDFLHKPIEADILRSKSNVFFELYRQQQLLIQQRDEIKITAAALQDADRRKDEFLATLAHELRNPLAPIKNGLQVLQMSPSQEVAENIRAIMDRQVTHLVRLIDDLLDVSRVSQGKIDLRLENITAQSSITSAIESSLPLIEENQHTLILDIKDEPLWIFADMTRLSQIVGNLINNAAKYTPNGGEITVKLYAEDKNIVIEVSDNGLGIPEEMLQKVFELFTQVNNNLDRYHGGLGIGLALVKQLVGMHEGTITAHSAGLGKGSTFTVCFPLAKDQQNTVSKTVLNLQKEESVTPLQVLVVDDNVASAQTIGWTLELIGHQPVLAHDGPEALMLAETMQPDVILLDIGLPGMSGYDVCKQLRQNPLFKDTVLIAQTGWGQERDRIQAFEAGFNHHLVKPVSMEDLSLLLNDIGKENQ